MNNRSIRAWLLFSWTLLVATPAGAADAPPAGDSSHPTSEQRPFSPHDAVTSAVKQNPELAAALSDLRALRSLVEGEAHRYTFVWGAQAGIKREEIPSLSPSVDPTALAAQPATLTVNATTQVPQSNNVSVSTDLRRRFAFGGDVGLTVSGDRSTSSAYFPPYPTRFSEGPYYGASVKLDAKQPLLRGFGNAVGEANLNQARIQADQNAATFHRITSDNLAAVLRAYWEFAYATQALQIQVESLRLAQQQRDEAKSRVETGSLADVELASFETRIAQLESDHSDAEVEVERRRIELERLCVYDTRNVSLAAPPDQAFTGSMTYAELLGLARVRSPSLRELKAAATLAKSQASIAGDSLRPALDVTAYVQARGLNNNAVGPAVRQVGDLSALSAYVGLRYETSLDSTQRRMQVAQSRFAVAAANRRVESAERQLEASLQRTYAEARASSRRLELAARVVELAERQYRSEKSLFQTGTTTAIRVREAEEQVRSSRLKQLRAKVDAVATEIELERLTGQLGEQYLALVK